MINIPVKVTLIVPFPLYKNIEINIPIIKLQIKIIFSFLLFACLKNLILLVNK